MIPGEYFIQDGDIICNEGREVTTLTVVNTGDRPIQVGSHYHFFEVNKMMEFDRALAFGKRLNIIASTAVRFEPGESKIVELVPYAGARRVYGHNDLVNGDTETEVGKMNALKKADANGFKNKKS
ncbi:MULTISPECIES: urease subunit beta [Sphingobacterium]|jgi:urease subunit beta|uniref:Urease subunit beta n=1 Tax=Sphingobacterium kitahiroshimense TaxID=470446 RepID=A0ABV0BWJ3_9SPHI|nr:MULTISPECIES: urease subunit beta [Sphingobacterium]UZJ66377.1 urease subunit beta [Sphingobacterium sp. KU25419]KKX50730.1 urease subunit beta [Sphingobacterium sp. IITKGP-BTPF85]MBB2953558.1 urease beta subunit [Sphingobacterium sp. JUb56]MCS3554879.1 urease beta subunit [Sphingobacterium sp. JUb21]MCW2262796.1 urease beta subunit [Sphingobacterium kitahiroshimense]